MTRVCFYRRNGAFYGFQETGHTGFGEEGDDILCSALSAMTLFLLNTLEIAYHADFDYQIDDKEAVITVICKSALPENGAESKVQFASSGLFEGYYYQLLDLTEEYYEFLSVDVVER